MNKTILLISSVILGGMFLTGSVLAATTISLSPTSVSVTQGESFNLVIAVNPQDVKNYTVKVELEYPTDLLEVKSFNFSSGWMALSQSGYDLIDNTNGILIKTAGYPGGLSSTATFGIISFSAKKAGSGVIKLSSNSLALDSENQNVLSSQLTQVAVSITAPEPVAPGPIAPGPTYPDEEIEEVEEVDKADGIEEAETIEEEEEVIIAEEEEEEQPEEQPSFLATIGNIITFGTGNASIGVIVSIIAFLILFFGIRRIRLRKSE